ARPARLPPPDFGPRPSAERLIERSGGEARPQAGAAHQLGGRSVLGDLVAEPLDAAPRLEDIAPPQHRFALRETEAAGVGRVLPARLVGVEKRAFDFRRQRLWGRADRRRAD